MNILIVDNDEMTRSLTKFLLEGEGFGVSVAANQESAIRHLDQEPQQLLLLELLSGEGECALDLCRKLREEEHDIPVVFLTWKNDTKDRVTGLRAGADDYIAKPFDPVELIERVKAVLRRYCYQRRSSPLLAGGLELNVEELSVATPQRRAVALTPTEMRVLRYLLLNIGRPVSREFMMSSIWGSEYMGESNPLDVYICRLRKKIEKDPSRPEILLTVPGIGYKLSA